MSVPELPNLPYQIGQKELSFEALFHEHWERICQIAYRVVGDQDEAQDLALESFMQLFRNPPHELTNPGGWLYRTVTRLALNALRAHKRRQFYESHSGRLEIESGAGADPAVVVEDRQMQDQVRAALSVLPPNLAGLLVLRYSGFSYSEIALVMKLSPGSIGPLLLRAKEEFAKVYRG